MKIIDKYIGNKVWIISKSECRHYYMEQEICGRRIGKKVRTTKAHLLDIGLKID